MNLNELKKYDPSLETLFSNESNVMIKGLTNLDFPKEGHVVFIRDKKYFQKLKLVWGSAAFKKMGVILDANWANKLMENLKDEWELLKDRVDFVLKAANMNLCMSKISEPFYLNLHAEDDDLNDGRETGTADINPEAKVSASAFVGKGVVVGKGSIVHAGVVLMSGVKIGENCVLYPNVTVYHNVVIGNGVRLHGGATIGADGFGYNFDAGIHHKVWHFGSVIIEDNVEIGANSCVDGGTFSPTRIGSGSKLDNHVQIGHNCQLGKGVVICGHVGIGGSSVLGDFTVFGGKSGMGDNMRLGVGCQVAGGALVNCDWPDGSIVAGHPARPVKEWMKGIAYVRKESLKK